MSPEEFQRLSALFEEARSLPLAEREAFLDRNCGGTPDLRARIQELLSEHDGSGPGLGISSPEISRYAASLSSSVGSSRDTRASSLDIKPGDVIDSRYRVLETLGEGGLGIVYLAEQLHPVKRRVALKVVKLGMDTRQVLARFEAERNTLTLMDHPGIARIHDAGVTERGRPYFVMEHIQGLPITEFANSEKLNTRDRLKLFMLVCAAVHHAHQKGIVHRDLKPSNILVSLQDGKPAPRIIDFGIAKATAHQLTQQTLFTEQGQLIGTPEYMSPEQAEMSGLGVDSTTDIYSLGVVLYELLTGVLPFDSKTLRAKPIHEIQRLIRDEDPPKPSTRVSSLGDTTQLIVKQRRTEPRALWRELKGDLDWITMKAMEKQRTRRYASSSELSADVQRHLDCQPVLAGPPSALYSVRKFARRNRAMVVSAAVVAVALLCGALAATWGMMESRSQRDRAVLALEETGKARDAAKAAQEAAIGERRIAEAALAQAEVNVYYSRVAQAELSFRLQDLAKSELSLESCSPEPGRADHRGWEWKYLNGVLHASTFSPAPHDSVVYSLAFSRDGMTLSSGGGVPAFMQFNGDEPGELKVWDLRRGDLLKNLSGKTSPVTGLAFSFAGDRLAVAAANIKTGGTCNLQIYETSSGKLISTLKIPPAARWIGSLNFDPGGNRLAARTDLGAHLWDIASSLELFNLPGQTAPLFTSDGERLLTFGREGSVNTWNASTGELIHRTAGFPPSPDRAVLGPDGALVAFLSRDAGAVLVHDGSTARLLRTIRSHPDEVSDVSFSPDGRLLATCGSGATVRVWSMANGEERLRFLGHTNRLERVVFSWDGDRIASGGWDGRVRIWDATRSAEHVSLESPSRAKLNRVEAIVFRKDGRMVTAHSNSQIRSWDARNGIPISNRRFARSGTFSVPSRKWDFAAGSSRLLRVSADERKLALLDIDTGAEVATLEGHSLPVSCVACSRDGARVAAAAHGAEKPGETSHAETRVWNVETGEVIFSQRLPDAKVTGLALSASGDWLLVAGLRPDAPQAGAAAFVALCALAQDFELAMTGPHGDRIDATAFSPDGRSCATGDAAGRTLIFRLDPAQPRPLKQDPSMALQGPAGTEDLAFSPDGKRLAAVNREIVTVWDTETGHEVISLRGQPRTVVDPMFNPRVAFSNDGLRIAANQWDETITIWSAEGRGEPGSKPTPDRDAAFAWHLREATDSLSEQNDRALQFHLSRVENTEPPSPELRMERGLLFSRVGKRELAIADFSSGLKLNPGDSVALEQRGIEFIRKGDWRAAAQDFEKCVLVPAGPSANGWIALFLLRLDSGDVESCRQSLPEFEEALSSADPETALLGSFAAVLVLDPPAISASRWREIESLCERQPGDLVACGVLAAHCVKSGEPERAAKLLRSTAIPAELSITTAIQCVLLSRVEQLYGHEEEAKKLLVRARAWLDRPGAASVSTGADWRLWLALGMLLREAKTGAK